MSSERSDLLQQQNDLIIEIVQSCAASRPEEWTRLQYRVAAIVPYMKHGVRMQLGAGAEILKFPPDDVLDYVEDLRTVMYRSGVGTWLSARFDIYADGRLDVDFNYDVEPDWGHEGAVTPMWWVDELTRYPRDDEAMPDWLKQRVTEGRAQLAAEGN